MGCLLVVAMWALSFGAVVLLLGGSGVWVLIVLGLLWLAAFVAALLLGHRGFGTGTNTDVMIMIAGAGIAAAVLIPQYEDHKPCGQAKAALRKLADVEKEYFLGHNAYTADFKLLEFTPPSKLIVAITRADKESFAATASHPACDDDNDGKPDIAVWNSAEGGLQRIPSK